MSKPSTHTGSRWKYAVFGTLALFFAGLIYAWSILSVPIARDFSQWTSAQLSLTFTLVMIFFCVGTLACGFIGKRSTPRMNLWCAAILFLCGFLLVSGTTSLLSLYLGFGVISGIASGIAYNTIMDTVTKWFDDMHGLISGILLMGYGIGSFLVGKLYQSYTPDVPGAWRNSFQGLAIIIFAVLLVTGFIMVRAPERKVDARDLKTSDEPEIPPSKMIRLPSMWFFYLWILVQCAISLAVISQASSIVQEVSPAIPAGVSATIVGMISVANGVGRIILGGVYDKYG